MMTPQVYRFQSSLSHAMTQATCCRHLVCSAPISRAFSSLSGEFKGQRHAELYSKHRPSPDEALVSNVMMNYVRKKTGVHSERLGIAVDIGCGSGQATEVIAGYLNKVIGIDASEAQIAEANKANTTGNIEYRCGLAGNLPVKDESVNLVTCFQAAHYMYPDFNNFCQEVSRVLTPNGCFAIYTRNKHDIIYPDKTVAKQLSDCYYQLYYTMKDYFVYDWQNVQDMYMEKFIFPDQFKDIKRYHLLSINTLTVGNFFGFVKSLSGYQKYHKKHPEQDLSIDFEHRFLDILSLDKSAEDTIIQLIASVYIVLACKEA